MRKTCVVCGGEFKAHRSAITCSRRCSMDRENQMAAKRRAENPEKFRAADRIFNARHAAKKAQRLKDMRGSNPDDVRAKDRDRYWRYRDKKVEYYRRRRQTEGDRLRRQANKRNAEAAAALRLVRELQSKGLEALL